MIQTFQDEIFMQRAIALALIARGKTSPNPMVGAIVARNGEIIGEGWHPRCGADHAEVIAIKKAGDKARGATLYVTLEPCAHHGRTPPCVDAVLKSGIKEVVIGVKDPNPLTGGKSIRKLKKAGLSVKVGILKADCLKLNEAFFTFMTQRRPFVVAKIAQSLDGKIAAANGHSRWVTGRLTRKYARRRRHEFDAIVVGINTVLKDNPRLSAPGNKRHWYKVILDSRLRISPKAGCLNEGRPGRIILVTTAQAPKSRRDLFIRKGHTVLVAPASSRITFPWLLKELAEKDVTSVLIEGGGEVIGSALNEKCVDRMHVYVTPKLLGHDGIPSVKGIRCFDVNKALRLRDVDLYSYEGDFIIEGYVKY